MVTFLGAVLGFLSAMFPEVMNLFKDRRDKEHEIKLMKLQMESRKAAQSERLEEIQLQGEAAEMQALYASVQPSSVRWVDALSATVRPVITYGFFAAYIAVKIAQYYMMLHASPLPWLEGQAAQLNWFDIVGRLWNEEDQAIFASIIAFWFGSRHFRSKAAS